MEVKGVAFLARQLMVVQDHGEAAWKAFLTEFAATEFMAGGETMAERRERQAAETQRPETTS